MQLNYLTIMVRDIDATTTFYRELVGLQEIRRMELEAGTIVFMAHSEGETMLEFIEFEQAEKVLTQGMVMSFRSVEPLEQVHERAVNLGYAPTEIKDVPPKPRYFTVADPDGITVEFSA